jgi:DNA adenine methylase
MQKNDLTGAAYVEPFAGAAGVAWALLFEGIASHVYLNDIDPGIYAFWHCVLHDTDDFCALIKKTRVSMATWHRSRSVIANPNAYPLLQLGFATFFLNRTNRSGVIRGGVIGGKDQAGDWRLNARYNKPDLLRRIRRIAAFGDKVSIYEMDAAQFIPQVIPSITSKALVYLDPPYMHRGEDLYWDTYQPADHARLAQQVMNSIAHPWIVTYDNVPATRHLYRDRRRRFYALSYSAANRNLGSEIMVFSPDLRIPRYGLPSRSREHDAAQPLA